MAANQDLPKTHRALILKSTSKPPTVDVVPTPQPTPGSCIVRIVSGSVISYAADVYNGKRQYPYPMPLTCGTSSIGRVVALGPDTVSLTVGQLVWIDCTIKGRDDPTAIFLSAVHQGFSEGSAKLMHGEWRDGTFAEYYKAPLENCHPLNEARLTGNPADGGLGYSIDDLGIISRLIVPYGGLRDIGLKPGETIVISPATGAFGGCGVHVAIAMGARVIAMGRNMDVLQKVASGHERIEAVAITGDVAADTAALKKFGAIDAFFDISPPAAQDSTHIKSAILALRPQGRVSLMGGIRGDIAIPHSFVMHRDITIKGKWMYPREAVSELLKMVEIGLLKIGQPAGFRIAGRYSLEEWEEAFKTAEKNAGMGDQTVIVP